MSTAWISEARQSQDRASDEHKRLSTLTARRANIWFREFTAGVPEIVEELNGQYPEKFNRDLCSMPGIIIELRCGPNVIFEASLISGVILKVMKHKIIGQQGKWKYTIDRYTARLDHNENLFFQRKDGQPIPSDGMSQELFAYLTDL